MRIAITHPYCWPEVRRGSERLVHDLSHHLAGRGHEVTVLSSAAARTGEEWEEGESGGRVRRVLFPQRQPLGVRNRWLHNFHWFGVQVHRALRDEAFDAVHCLNFHDACGALLARRHHRGMRVIYQMAGIAMSRISLVVPHDSWLFAHAVRHADTVLSVSRFAQDAMRTALGRESLLLPPPTRTDLYCANPRPAHRGVLDILFVGDLTEPRKGGALLAQAFAAVQAARPVATLTYSGHAPPEIQAALLAGLPPAAAARVRFLGVGQVGDLPQVYAQATLLVLPSAWEALGMVLVEALAAGMPVVACNHAGVTDVVNDPRIGSLFEPGPLERRLSSNTDGLVAAILRSADLAACPQTEALCRAHAERFGWPRLGPCYEAVLRGEAQPEPALGACAETAP